MVDHFIIKHDVISICLRNDIHLDIYKVDPTLLAECAGNGSDLGIDNTYGGHLTIPALLVQRLAQLYSEAMSLRDSMPCP